MIEKVRVTAMGCSLRFMGGFWLAAPLAGNLLRCKVMGKVGR
jgi:hypothetical protein